MATITDRATGKTPFALRVGQRGTLTAVVDTGDADLTACGSGDVMLLAPLQKGQIIERVRSIVDEAEGGTATIDVGIVTWDGTTLTEVDYDGFLNDADMNATAGTVTATVEAQALDQGYLVPGTTTYLAAKFNNAMDAGRFRICADLFLPEPAVAAA